MSVSIVRGLEHVRQDTTKTLAAPVYNEQKSLFGVEKNKQALFVGCVMGWELQSQPQIG